MKKFDFLENGIHLQFVVDKEEHLSLFNLSTKPAVIPEDFLDHLGAWAAVQVQCAGDNAPTNRHISHSDGARPRYVCHEDTRNAQGRLLIFTVRTETLEIKQHYQFYDGVGVISCYADVTNIGTEAAGLQFVSSFAYAGLGSKYEPQPLCEQEIYIPHNSWSEELNWRKRSLREAGFNTKHLHASTERIHCTNRGCWSTKEYLPMGIFHDTVQGEYYFWQIESNGSWTWEMGDVQQRIYLSLSGPCEHDHAWYKNLKPGESFRTVPAAIAISSGTFDDVVGEMTTYRRKTVDAGRLDNARPVIFNDYMDCLWGNPTTETELPMIERAAALGAEIYCMDSGWYATGAWNTHTGEWKICNERFTGGLKSVFDKIHECGMRAGIWLEPEVMGDGCVLEDEFRDCFFYYRGKPIISRGRYQLDFRKQKVRDHLNRVVDMLIDELGVSYFKFDYNCDPIFGTEVDADSCGDGQLQCNRAFLEWVDSLYERHPGLMIENCSSGGLRMEYGSLKHFAIQSVSDAVHYEEYGHMSVMAPTAVLPEQAGIWVSVSDKNTPEQNAYAAVNGMLHRMYMSGRIDKITEADLESLKTAVKEYKKIRADLTDALPIFPSGLCHTDSEWMFGGCVTADKKRLYVTAIHQCGESDTASVTLDQLNGKNGTVEVIYPLGVGDVALCGNELQVKLPKTAAVLLKITLD